MLDEDDEMDDEGMDEETAAESTFPDWYDDNYSFFNIPGPLQIDPPLEVEVFYQKIYCPVMEEIYPVGRKLLNEHYPFIGTERRPILLNKIDADAKYVGHSFLMQFYGLLRHVEAGDNLREAYPDFDKMSERLKDDHYFRKDVFDSVEGLTDKQKQQLYRLALEKFEDSYNYKDQRRYEFIDSIHPIVFEHCPTIQDFSMDAWVVYNYLLRLEHVEYRLTFEFYHSFIDCGLPIDDLQLTRKEIHEKINQLYTERYKNRSQLE